jgi:hypothetical protein
LKIIGIVVATIVLIVVIAMMVALSRNGRGHPVKRARHRPTRDDDDD